MELSTDADAKLQAHTDALPELHPMSDAEYIEQLEFMVDQLETQLSSAMHERDTALFTIAEVHAQVSKAVSALCSDAPRTNDDYVSALRTHADRVERLESPEGFIDLMRSLQKRQSTKNAPRSSRKPEPRVDQRVLEARQRRAVLKTMHVYVAELGQLVKVGISTRPKERLRELAFSCGSIGRTHYMPCTAAFDIEQSTLRAFDDDRKLGEFLDAPFDDVLSYVVRAVDRHWAENS